MGPMQLLPSLLQTKALRVPEQAVPLKVALTWVSEIFWPPSHFQGAFSLV
jgi:hypothetical protein